MQMTIEVLLHLGYVAHLSDAAHRNLLPAIRVRLWLRHFAFDSLLLTEVVATVVLYVTRCAAAAAAAAASAAWVRVYSTPSSQY